MVPGRRRIGGRIDAALALARTAHHRLDDARVADAAIDRGAQFGERIGEGIRACRQRERLGGEPADAFTVHRQTRRARGRHDAHDTGGFQLFEHAGCDGLYLGHDEIRPLGLDQRLELRRIAHRDGARVVRHLVAGRGVVAVDGDRLDPQALQRDQHFLAELAAAEQHDAGGVG